MADFEYPEWNQPGIEPPQSKKDEGWLPTEKPPAEWFNWFFNRASLGLKHLEENSSSNTALLESTGYGVIEGLRVSAQNTPDMTVKVEEGVVHMLNGVRFAVAAITVLAILVADPALPRKDLIYINRSGQVTYAAGIPATSPVAPTLPNDGELSLANINVAAGATSITDDMLVDTREFKATNQIIDQRLRDISINIKSLRFVYEADYTGAFNRLVTKYPNGVNLFIPEGEFLTDSFTLPPNTMIFGVPGKSKIKLKNNATNHLIYASNVDNITLLDVDLDGNASNQSNSALFCVRFDDCSNIKIDKCDIHDAPGVKIVSIAAMTKNIADITVTNSHIYNSGDHNKDGSYLFIGGFGLYPSSQLYNVNVKKNKVYCLGTDALADGMEFVSLNGYFIEENECHHMGGYGISLDSFCNGLGKLDANNCHHNGLDGIGSNGVPLYTLAFNNGSIAFVLNSTLTQAVSGATGIITSYQLTSGSFADGNAAGTLVMYNITGTWSGTGDINVGGTKYAETAGSISSPIIGDSNPIISNNQCNNNQGHGIRFTSLKKSILDNNTCNNNGFRGIAIETPYSEATIVSRNKCSGNAYRLTGSTAADIWVGGTTNKVTLAQNICDIIAVSAGATNIELEFNKCDNYSLAANTCSKIDGMFIGLNAPTTSVTGIPLYRGSLYYQASKGIVWKYEESGWEPMTKAKTTNTVTPDFVGQVAVVGTNAYIAVGVSSSADWKLIS